MSRTEVRKVGRFGHERINCVVTYATVTEATVENEASSLEMDEEEAEEAAEVVAVPTTTNLRRLVKRKRRVRRPRSSRRYQFRRAPLLLLPRHLRGAIPAMGISKFQSQRPVKVSFCLWRSHRTDVE